MKGRLAVRYDSAGHIIKQGVSCNLVFSHACIGGRGGGGRGREGASSGQIRLRRSHY